MDTGGTLPVTLFIGHDPYGTPASFRDRLGYDLGAFNLEPTLSSVPPELRFGEIRWKRGSTMRSLEVYWYPDYEAWRRAKYIDTSKATGIRDY